LHTANRAEALRARKVLKELLGQDGEEETTNTDDGDINLPILPASQTGPAALMACHVAPEGAKVLDLATSGHPKAGKLPDNLAALLAPGGGAYWVPGLRVGSPECLHKGDGPGSGKNLNLNKSATANSSKPPLFLKLSQTFTFVELFAGVGGFRVGLEAVGGRCVFSSEIDQEAVATYKLNHGDSGELYGDITELEVEDLPPHDLLCAGWPCQPFSRAGFQAGFEDIDRGHLFFEIIRCVQAARPRILILENVANLVKVEEGRTLMASYKRSYHLYSEFVPVGSTMQESAELPKELRFYTPRECARLMGFPETFRVGESTNRNAWYHQCGNSVCPPIIAAIMAAVQVALDKSNGSGVDGADMERVDEAVARLLLAASPRPAEVRARLEGAGYRLS